MDLDSDGYIGSNLATADSVEFSMRKLDYPDNKLKINGLCSESGYRGVREGLLICINDRQHITDHPLQYTCSLHGISFILFNPVLKLIGVSKVKLFTPNDIKKN